ncbi:hypothetical protein, partial [Oleiphilus sp. HI0086]|uniref:hypothetical protein n=1 Tax=Oleiphilus sp. HI0086 TaxID=1822260 RepID=UPI000ADFCCA0
FGNIETLTMRTLRLTTLDNQRQRLEREIIETKKKIVAANEGAFPDLGLVKQLRDSIERNMQLISMIDQHRPARISKLKAKVI